MSVFELPSSSLSRSTDHQTILLNAARFFAAAELLHGADHIRRGPHATPPDVMWLGLVGSIPAVLVVVFIAQRHRIAGAYAAVMGVILATGYSVVHFLPTHKYFSDSFTSFCTIGTRASNINPLSWVAASLEVAAALTVAAAGIFAVRSASSSRSDQDRIATSAPAPRPLLSAVMIIGNLIAGAISLYQMSM